jgi:hypothetical protein
VLLGVALSQSASAALIAYDGFDYATGSLEGEEGGTGDWKDKWQGDADIEVMLGGYSYVDAFGNALDVVGNHIESAADNGSANTVSRPLNDKIGDTNGTFWMSVLLDGSSSSAIHNASLGAGLFIGQGGKDTGSTTWLLSDQDGLVGDTGVSSDGLALLVLRVDFTGGDETAWLWIDPRLDVEPGTGSADASGTIKSFESDFIQIQLELPTGAGLDEVRVGNDFADVTPYAALPEPGTVVLVGLGLMGMTVYARRCETLPAAAH